MCSSVLKFHFHHTISSDELSSVPMFAIMI